MTSRSQANAFQASASSLMPRVGFGRILVGDLPGAALRRKLTRETATYFVLQIDPGQAGFEKSVLLLTAEFDLCLCGAAVWSLDKQV